MVWSKPFSVPWKENIHETKRNILVYLNMQIQPYNHFSSYLEYKSTIKLNDFFITNTIPGYRIYLLVV
jgi:hypothetical protein